MTGHAEALALFGDAEDLGPDSPLVYLAMPLSHLKGREDQDLVELLAHAVRRAVDDACLGSGDAWRLRVHSPATWSAPWKKDNLTPEGVYELNSTKLWEEADGLIVIGHRGGSLGAGQELAWACSLHLPILYLHKFRTPVSRQLLGAVVEHDLEVRSYRSPEDLADIVGRWLCSRRHVIADGPRRRRNRMLRFSQLRARLSEAWGRLDCGERDHVVAVTRIAPGRVARLLSSVSALSQASITEVADLAGALRVQTTTSVAAAPLPDLRPDQTSALLNAAAEFGWGPEETFELYGAARLEVARGGVRRLPFASPYDWQVFRTRRRNGQ